MPSPSTPKPPPSWVLEPITAWSYLAASVGMVLVVEPALAVLLPASIAAAYFTYADRRAHGFPVFWWTAAVAFFGAFGFVFFVYKRTRGPIVFTPQASIAQQGRLVRGLPPQEIDKDPGRRAPAGWYPDPTGNTRVRFWDGSEWTDHTAA
jgi:hypothetical protein